MAYGLSNSHVTDDVTWPPKVLWCSTVGYPSDSLASCYCTVSLSTFVRLSYSIKDYLYYSTHPYKLSVWFLVVWLISWPPIGLQCLAFLLLSGIMCEIHVITICVEWAVDYFGLSLTQIDPLLTKICVKNDLYIFVLSELDQGWNYMQLYSSNDSKQKIKRNNCRGLGTWGLNPLPSSFLSENRLSIFKGRP